MFNGNRVQTRSEYIIHKNNDTEHHTKKPRFLVHAFLLY